MAAQLAREMTAVPRLGALLLLHLLLLQHLMLAVEGRPRAAISWPCLHRAAAGKYRASCSYAESRVGCALRLRLSGGGGGEEDGDDSAHSVSAPEHEGPGLPDAKDGPPPPKSILKVSDDGEVWVDKEGQEQADNVDEDGCARKVVETYDLGPDIPCSCEYCTSGAEGDSRLADCERSTERRSKAGGQPYLSPRLEEELGRGQEGGDETAGLQEMGAGIGGEPVEWEDDSQGAAGADLSDGGGGRGSSPQWDVDDIVQTCDTPGLGLAEGPVPEWPHLGAKGDCGELRGAWQDFGFGPGGGEGKGGGDAGGGPGDGGGGEGRDFGAFARYTKEGSDLMWAMRSGDEEGAIAAMSRGADRQVLNDQLLESAKVCLACRLPALLQARTHRAFCAPHAPSASPP